MCHMIDRFTYFVFFLYPAQYAVHTMFSLYFILVLISAYCLLLYAHREFFLSCEFMLSSQSNGAILFFIHDNLIVQKKKSVDPAKLASFVRSESIL